MRRDFLFHTMCHALDIEHCVICHLALRNVYRFLDGFIYERVNDSQSRQELLAARGFCSTHAWQLSEIRHASTGIAVVYRHLLAEFCRAFADPSRRQIAGTGGTWWLRRPALRNEDVARDIQRWLEPVKSCPACTNQWETEERFVHTVAESLSDPDFRSRYERSMGACVRHLKSIIARAHQPDDLDWLQQTEQRVMERLIHDLAEFWRKHDYRFQHEPMSDEEKTCWTRVLHKLAGGSGMVWRR